MAAAGAAARRPDVEEHQIAVVSADLESEVIVVTQARVLPLPRGGGIPARIRGQLYYVSVLTDAELDGARAERHALANVIGAGGVVGPAAGAAHQKLGETIDVAILGDAGRMVTRGASARVRVEEDGHTFWTFAVRIGDANGDASGAVLTGAFAQHVAEEQKSAATTMKQSRKKNKGDKDKGKGNQGKGDG